MYTMYDLKKLLTWVLILKEFRWWYSQQGNIKC